MHGRKTSPSAPGVHVARLRREEVVGVAETHRFRVALDRRELVAPPAQVAARDEPGVLEQPGVGVGVRVAFHQHRRVLARLGARRADRLGGADHVADLAGREHAGAERRRHLVAAPDRHDRRRVQPARLGERRGHGADGLGAGAPVAAASTSSTPVAARASADHARVRGSSSASDDRVRVVDGERRRSRGAARRSPGGMMCAARRPGVGLLVADPQRLEHRVRRVEVRADRPVEVLG